LRKPGLLRLQQLEAADEGLAAGVRERMTRLSAAGSRLVAALAVGAAALLARESLISSALRRVQRHDSPESIERYGIDVR
jgi:hypothetical protein